MPDIFDEIRRFEKEMEELLDGFLHSRRSIVFGHPWKPAINIIETEENLIILVEASGVKSEDVKIKADNDYIIISGKRDDPFYSENCNYYAMEIDFGNFERIIRLPVEVEIEKISVNNEDGFIKIILPLKRIIEKEIEIE
uniref:Hsp20/alpha crystallin family protein n=1 Tax=candidate division WOR-3 bacterium TaxID=2052148 RepID=A0A7C4U9U3_UNCW3